MKTHTILRDYKKRLFYIKAEIFQLIIKVIFLFRDKFVLKAVVKKKLLEQLLMYEYRVGIKNVCVLTGRTRGVYQFFRVSRIQLRLLGSDGLFFGLKKHS
jgi:ribosomal protein S14